MLHSCMDLPSICSWTQTRLVGSLMATSWLLCSNAMQAAWILFRLALASALFAALASL